MFDHVTIRVAGRAASERFYDAVLGALGRERSYTGDDLVEWSDFSLMEATEPAKVTRRLGVGFAAPSPGATDDRRDPDGNNIEAVSHNRP